VGTEIVKALVAGGGGVGERDEMQKNFSRAGSPAAIGGSIDTAERLLAGQFIGLKKQYEQTTHRDDFEDRMTPEALEIFHKMGGSPGGAQMGGDAHPPPPPGFVVQQ
jgi:hypothetical protein